MTGQGEDNLSEARGRQLLWGKGKTTSLGQTTIKTPRRKGASNDGARGRQLLWGKGKTTSLGQTAIQTPRRKGASNDRARGRQPLWGKGKTTSLGKGEDNLSGERGRQPLWGKGKTTSLAQNRCPASNLTFLVLSKYHRKKLKFACSVSLICMFSLNSNILDRRMDRQTDRQIDR